MIQRRWQESVDSAVIDYPEVKFRLLRDHGNPTRFVSFGEGWRTVEQVETILSREAIILRSSSRIRNPGR